jgi:PIN domain nuclease of toxin-antitoxin system
MSRMRKSNDCLARGLTPLLIDSHALLWSLGDDHLLSPAVHDALSAGVVPAYVSAASIWEIAIKRAQGKLNAPENLLDKVAAARFIELRITFEHAILAGALPTHHGDPFDRMIVAQAQSEGLTIVTRDERIAAYDVPVLW